MMRHGKARCALACMAAALFAAPVAGQTDDSARSGFGLSVGLGRGNTGVTCEDCAIDVDDRLDGISGYLRIGTYVSPRAFLGIEGTGWIRNSDGLERRIAALSLVVVAYPTSAGFFVRAGAGGIRAVVEDALVAIVGEGITWSAGAGYDIGAGGIALTPFVTYLNSVEVAAHANDVSLGVNLNPNILQFGLAITTR